MARSVGGLPRLQATLGCAGVAAQRIDFAGLLAGVMGGLWLLAIVLGVTFLRTVSGRFAKGIEVYSAIWTLALYLTLGVIPLWLSAT